MQPKLPGRFARRFRRSAAGLLLAAGLTSLLPAMSVRAPSFGELVAEAGQIVRGRVIGVEAFDAVSPEGAAFVKTRVTWETTSALKGAPSGTLTLEFLGGRTAARRLTIPGMPQFTVGQEEFLFVDTTPRVLCPVVAAGYGRYFVERDDVSGREFVTRDNRVPLTDVAQVNEPLGNALPAVLASRPAAAALTAADFETAVRRELARANGGQHAE